MVEDRDVDQVAISIADLDSDPDDDLRAAAADSVDMLRGLTADLAGSAVLVVAII